ncbi:MAG: 50S ribosomal protein L25/general stress protein Ctc [Actinomycetales bacterium]|uniref:Large ribosomal subunit protein bL25 n=1 Tax=Candidatus Phosphoribacter hodrii TaxID=2953743 RepID=A0A9D7TFL5_9MICO|nr:50S ribosomal protein L25/general stress protein Ctc [Candidatus Phosphoribacter hodrii]
MSEIKLPAERRNSFGKGAARKIRRDHKIPAVLYGHGTDPVHITLPAHDTALALKHANALLSIELEGQEPVGPGQDIQRDPIRPIIEHIDLVIVRKGEKVNVDVPVHIEGEAGPDTIVNVESNTIELLVEATHIPESVVVSVEDLPAGTQIKAGELVLPEGATLVTDEDALIVNITGLSAQEPDADAEAEPAAAATATADAAE